MIARMLGAAGLIALLGGCRPVAESSVGAGPAETGTRTAPIASAESAAAPGVRRASLEVPVTDTRERRFVIGLAAAAEPSGEPSGGSTGGTVAAARNETSVPAREGGSEDPNPSRAPLFVDWPKPRFVMAISGRQNGYLEPCGCTGLTKQKGGLARRQTLLRDLARRDWPVVAIDVGNQVRRFGRQAEIQFQISVGALSKMGFAASTFGPDDLRLTIDELAATTAPGSEKDTAFVSANVAILDREFTPRFRVATVAGRRIGIVGVLGDQARAAIQADEILTEPAVQGVRAAWQGLSAEPCDHTVLLVQGTREETIAIAQAVPRFDIVATSGGGDEPTLVPERIPGTPSQLVQVGIKGMYVGVLAFFDGSEPGWRYQRVPLDARFEDSREMLALLATYQQQLEQQGLEGLGVRPLPHPSGRRYVGSESCGDCHAKAMEVWKESDHGHATDSLVKPGERSDIARHFDPECLSCHVTGWNPQRFTPYESGYLGLAETPKMVGSGCENCHGPGSRHAAAESGDVSADAATLSRLRAEMRLPLAEAEKKCMECHDLDNSPDFHEKGAFESFWTRIAHPGKD